LRQPWAKPGEPDTPAEPQKLADFFTASVSLEMNSTCDKCQHQMDTCAGPEQIDICLVDTDFGRPEALPPSAGVTMAPLDQAQARGQLFDTCHSS